MTKQKPIYVLNGPNLNLLGTRDTAVYGTQSLADIDKQMRQRAKTLGVEIEFFQTNEEGQLVNLIHNAHKSACALIINAGAYTHTSVALYDALQALDIPVVEVHISNVFKREDFRHHSYISPAALGVICGFGTKSYLLALEAVAT